MHGMRPSGRSQHPRYADAWDRHDKIRLGTTWRTRSRPVTVTARRTPDPDARHAARPPGTLERSTQGVGDGAEERRRTPAMKGKEGGDNCKGPACRNTLGSFPAPNGAALSGLRDSSKAHPHGCRPPKIHPVAHTQACAIDSWRHHGPFRPTGPILAQIRARASQFAARRGFGRDLAADCAGFRPNPLQARPSRNRLGPSSADSDKSLSTGHAASGCVNPKPPWLLRRNLRRGLLRSRQRLRFRE